MYDITRQCGICNIQLNNNKAHSIHDLLENLHVKVYDALISISNFDCFNINDGPQQICKTCFQITSIAYTFQKQCNKAAANILAYLKHQQESNNVIFIKEESNGEYYKETTPLDINIKHQEENNIKEIQYLSMDKCENKEELVVSEETMCGLEICNENNLKEDQIKQVLIDEAKVHKIIELNVGEQISIRNKSPEMELKTDAQILSVVKTKKSKKKYKLIECEICHKIVGSNNIQEHIKVHSDEKPYSCQVCDKRFNRRNNLKKHQAIHDNHRSFLCNVCGKSFNIIFSLQEHERIHTGERPHSCKICGKAFAHLYTLKNHYAVHSDEKLFTCEICGKNFSTKKGLKQHSSVHVVVKSHDCKMCGNQFKTIYALRIHLKNHCKGLS